MPSICRAAQSICRPAPGSGRSRASRGPASVLALCGALLLALGLVRPAGAGPVQMVSSDERGVTLRLTIERYDLGPPDAEGRREILIPDLYLTDVPGRPKLPYATALVALPPGASATASVIDGAEEAVDGVKLMIGDKPVVRADPDGLGYVAQRDPVPAIMDGSWPPNTVEVGGPYGVRRQRVALVRLQPFRYDAISQRLWTRRTLTVRVDFKGAEPVSAGAAVAAEDVGFEPILRTSLLNYEQGRRWRKARPALGRGLFARPQGLRSGRVGTEGVPAFDETEPEVRVRIASTGAWVLHATELLAKGFPAGVPITEVSVHRHEFVPNIAAPNPPYVTFEVPVEVEDADGDQAFTPGDSIVFYAQSWWERSGLAYDLPLSHAQRSWGEADYFYVTRVHAPRSGLRIQTQSGWGGLTLTPLATYPYRGRWEQNTSYNSAPRDTTQDPFMWITRPNYYTRPQLPFETYDLDTTKAVSVGATWSGLLSSYEHWVYVAVKNGSGQITSVVDSSYAFGKVTVTKWNSTLNGSALSEGATNKLMIWGKRLDAPPCTGSGCPQSNAFPDVALEWFDATYWRSYKAIGGYLSCNNGTTSGPYEIFATGFADSSTLRVYDVTDSSTIRRLIATPKEATGPFSFGIRFQDNAAPGESRRYLVFDAPKTPAPEDYATVDRVALTDIYAHAPGHNGDYLLIVPEVFRSTVGPLVTLRESQGLKVIVAPLEELNDAFNGGRKSPYAIKRFIRYAYDNWDARFVLLVGDGSEDPQSNAGHQLPPFDNLPLSSADFVPTQRIMGPVPASDAGGETFLQAIVSDPWYVWKVDLDFPFLQPLVPDLHIGRLPVNTVAQATGVITKIVNYESVTPDQTWRRKMVLFSDDAYSGNTFGVIGTPSTYCFQSGELVFKAINTHIRSIILDEAGLSQSEPELFNLADYLEPHTAADTAACSPPGTSCRCDGRSFITRARQNATPALFTRLAEGRLWWNFQGHANETVLSHEAFYANNYNGLPDDKDALQNYGKPFIFTAFSCHPNAFGHYRENATFPAGPSLGEDMVNLADRGAIASWASSGFELLPSQETKHININFARALFSDPPRDPQLYDLEGGARVVLGEVISKAELLYADSVTKPPPVSTYERDVMISYNLLGDPATRVTIGAPQAVFKANQTPVTDGVPVRLFTIGDSLRIEGDLVSNARIDTVFVEFINGSSTTAVAATDSLTPAFPDTTKASGGGRRYHIVFRTRLTVGSYTYRFRTVDRYGTPGRFDAVFRFETHLVSTGGYVRDGDVVGPNAALTLLLLSPSPLNPATDLALKLDNQPLTITATPANNDLSGREWNLTWNYGPYSDGSHQLDLSVGGVHAATHTFQVKSQLVIQNPLAFPNPFNDEKGTVFSFYLETDRPSKVLLRIYTIAGRMIYERVTSVAAAGYQQIPWNGLDAEGASLANGVYFYRITADNGASSSRYEGRLVRLRKPTHVSDEAP